MRVAAVAALEVAAAGAAAMGMVMAASSGSPRLRGAATA
jgi:hypothetical protein